MMRPSRFQAWTKAWKTALAWTIVGVTGTQAQAPGSAADLRNAIEQTARELFALGASPGLGLVVVRDTQTLFAGGFGFANQETRQPFTATTPFYIASTTKSFTGLAAAILEQQGKWRLDAPLRSYLPNAVLHPPMSANWITIRDLLTHTHGITNGGPVVMKLAFTGDYTGNDDLLRLLREHPPAPTGRAYSYSNLGYNIATFAMDAVTGTTWKQTLRELVFDPLRMTNTTAYASSIDTLTMAQPYRGTLQGSVRRNRLKVDATMHSAGGLFTTPEDMGRWLQAHINDGRIAGRQVIPAAAIQESHKKLVTTNVPSNGIGAFAYGLGWQFTMLGGDTLLTHGGGFPGYATQMSFMPNRRVGVAVMANNLELGGRFALLVAQSLYVVLQTGKPLPADSIASVRRQLDRRRVEVLDDLKRRAARSQVLRFPREAYVGSFDNPIYGRLTITKVGNELEARLGHSVSSVEVYDAGENQLRVELFGGGSVVNVTMKRGRAVTLNFAGADYQRVQ